MRIYEIVLEAQDSIAMTLAGLVKNNNGKFKSEKQAFFILNRIKNEGQGAYVVTGNYYNNPFRLYYKADADGVISVTKNTDVKGNEVVWQRRELGIQTVQDTKEIKRIKREISNYEKSILRRKQAIEEYREKDPSMELYNMSIKADEEALAAYKDRLAKFEGL